MGNTGKKVANSLKKGVKAASPTSLDDIKGSAKSGAKAVGIKDPKMPGMPAMPETAGALTTEDKNVRSVAEAERKRLYSGSGRSGTSILEGDYSNTKDKDDLLGG
jgi:hypothetical protein